MADERDALRIISVASGPHATVDHSLEQGEAVVGVRVLGDLPGFGLPHLDPGVGLGCDGDGIGCPYLEHCWMVARPAKGSSHLLPRLQPVARSVEPHPVRVV